MGPSLAIARRWALAPIALLLGSVAGFSAPTFQDPRAIEETGGPLIVDGAAIPPDEIKRFVIYRKFRMELDNQVDEILIQRAMNRIPASEWGRFRVPPERLQTEKRVHEARFRVRYPSLDRGTARRRYAGSERIYERMLRQKLRFQQAYFPDHIEQWPDFSRRALEEAFPSYDALDDYIRSVKRARAAFFVRVLTWSPGDPTPQFEPIDTVYRAVLRDPIHARLLEETQYATLTSDLPPEALASFEGEQPSGERTYIRTDEVWSIVQDAVTDQDLWEARQFLALIEATKLQLSRQGRLLPWPEAQKRWTERWASRRSKKPDFRFEEAERMLAHLYESIEHPKSEPGEGKGPKSTGTPLAMYSFQKGIGCIDFASVELDLLLVAAYDRENHRWKPDGWNQARAIASKLREALNEDPTRWPALLASHGEFWTFPRPSAGCDNPAIFPFRGSRGTLQRHRTLRANLQESDLSNFLTRDYLSEKILFGARLNQIEGPYGGPWGYYFVRVDARDSSVLGSLRDPVLFAHVYEDQWCLVQLTRYAHWALSQAEVIGHVER